MPAGFPISSPPSTAVTSPRPRHPRGGHQAPPAVLHAAAGALERVIHGVYRLMDYAAHPHGDMIAVTLWAGPDSAISHQSALADYGPGPAAMPAAIHLTAPSFQGRRQGVRIHHEELGDGERHRRDEVPVTTVERTLADITRSSDTSLLRDAVSHPSIAG